MGTESRDDRWSRRCWSRSCMHRQPNSYQGNWLTQTQRHPSWKRGPAETEDTK